MIRRFQKKPLTVEAVYWDGTEEALEALAELFHSKWTTPDEGALSILPTAARILDDEEGRLLLVAESGCELIIFTPEGMTGLLPRQGWVIRGIQGEAYPIRDEILRASYDPLDEEPVR